MAQTPPAFQGPWVGRKAPLFALPDQSGKLHRLTDYAGCYLIIFFYPKDSTGGCRAEVCGFRDATTELQTRRVALLGISILGVKSKAKFATELALNFPLLADEDHAVSESYGVWVEKSMYGRKYMGISRQTLVIAPTGVVAAHWEKAPASETHAAEVLAWFNRQPR